MKRLAWLVLLLATFAVAGETQVSVRGYKGVWQSGTSYLQGETCFYQGKTYIAVIDTQGVTPGTDETKWVLRGADDIVVNTATAAPGGFTPGMVVFMASGTCPSGWTELASAGNTIKLTVAANNDVGTTGGSNTYTPAGTVGVTVDNHADHQHVVTMVTNRTAAATTGSIYTPKTLSGTALASGTTSVNTGNNTAPLTHNASGSFTGTQATIDVAHIKLIGCVKQ